jgi:hypothetical protein
MPKAFDDCRAAGGTIRTVKPTGRTYLHVCVKDGKSYAGEVKKLMKRASGRR